MDILTKTYLGQVAAYMLEIKLKYAFLTTYEETVFLRKVDASTQWAIQYSPVILHSDRGSASSGTVSLCQSLYYVALLGQANPDFGVETGVRNQVWTEERLWKVMSQQDGV